VVEWQLLTRIMERKSFRFVAVLYGSIIPKNSLLERGLPAAHLTFDTAGKGRRGFFLSDQARYTVVLSKDKHTYTSKQPQSPIRKKGVC
jgi:hypothetical protein